MGDWNDDMRNEGTWQRMKGKVRETWGDITDNDLDKSRGNMSQMVGTIKEKTGETNDRIEAKLKEWSS